MKEIVLKSKVLSIPDYKKIDIISQFPQFICDKNVLEMDMKRLLFSKGTQEQVDEVALNDLVFMSCQSSLPRYNKEDIYVIVGKNLYNTELEKQLIGIKKGIDTVIQIDNIDVNIRIKEIIRTHSIPLTDASMPLLGIDGVSTIAELKRYFFNRQIDAFREEDEAADMVITYLVEKVSDNSEFDLDEEEIRAVEKTVYKQFEEVKQLRKELIAKGEASEDDGWDIDSMYESIVSGTIRGAAIGCQMMLDESKVLNEDDYENEVKRRASEYNKTGEEIKKEYSLLDYALQYYSEYFFNKMDEWVGFVMKEEYYKNGIDSVYDVAILGSGPAGLSAALNLKLHNKSIIWFGAKELSDKVNKSEKIANYPGFTRISGKELNAKFMHQIEEEGLKIQDKIVTSITYNDGKYMVLANNVVYEAKTILLSTGAVAAKGFINEEALLGKGVSYCATCDGFLYPGKTIAVFCGSKKYEHEVEYLAEIASQVYLFAGYKGCEINLDNVEILPVPIKSISGENKVQGIILTNGEEVSVDGIFILRNSVIPTTLLKGLKMDGPHIVVDRQCRTNLQGVYAAGDCTGRPYQITKAVGEGNIAAHSIVKYLSQLKL